MVSLLGGPIDFDENHVGGPSPVSSTNYFSDFYLTRGS